MKFSDLALTDPIARAVASEGYTVATPIQAQAIPFALEGRDVLGSARTGTGKTAAFALPILQRLSTQPRATGNPLRARCLILCPTRELATQISESFRVYGKNLQIKQAVIFGGVSQMHQVQAFRRGLDIVVATPGRLLDLMEQGHVDLRGIEVLVLDEADRMLDMGFINDIRRIVGKLPAQRQTMLFSATMPREIRTLAEQMLRNPATVQVAAVSSTADGVDQSVYFVEKRNKPVLLAHLVNDMPMTRAIVFTKTKHGADRVVRQLESRGIKAEAIHGNKSQNNRQRALANFKANKTPVLVATDIASRGIDIDGITHVVNYDLTHEPETYVHRIGRTARAGATGKAVSFCDRDEIANLKAIERLIKKTIAVCNQHPPYPAVEQNGESPRRPHSVPGHAPRREGSRSEGQSHRSGGASRSAQASSHRSAHAPPAGQASHAPRSTGHAPAGRPAISPTAPRGMGRSRSGSPGKGVGPSRGFARRGSR